MEAADQGAKPHLTMANEDYLRVHCAHRGGGARPGYRWLRSVEIAQRLDVSKASVNKAIASLKSQGMVEQAHYGKVRLTEEGRSIGAAVWRRHRMLRAFLTDELGVEFDRADEEACKMEHALSEDTMDRWIAHMERDGTKSR